MPPIRPRPPSRLRKRVSDLVSYQIKGDSVPATCTKLPAQETPVPGLSDRVPLRTTFLDTPQPASVTPDTLSITLPVPPSINHQYATVNGRRLLSATGRAYKTQVGQQVWLALTQSPFRIRLRDRLRSEPLVISIKFFFASSLRRDLDGGLKITQDAVCEGLGINDNRIVETHLYKHVDKSSPRIEVSLSLCLPSHPLT